MADNEEQASLVVAAVNEATDTLREVQKSFEDFEGSAKGLGITAVTLGGILKDVLAKAFQELKDAVKLGMREAIEAEQIHMKLMNAFKAEGASAKDSVNAIEDYSKVLGESIAVDNDVINASAVIIRQMTGLSAEIINRLLPSLGDLAIKTGSYESASNMAARAINGHARGLKMLGVDVVLTGDKAKNAEILIKAFNEQFGGIARDNLETTGGKLQELEVTYTDLAQGIGAAIIKAQAFQTVLSAAKNIISGIKAAIEMASYKPPKEDWEIEEADYNKLSAQRKKYLEEDYNVVIINKKATTDATVKLTQEEKDKILKIQDDLQIARTYKNNEGRDRELMELKVWYDSQMRDLTASDERRLEIEKLYQVKLKTLKEDWHAKDLEKMIAENADILAVKKQGQDAEDAWWQARWAEEDQLYYQHAHAVAGIISETAGAAIQALSGSMMALLSGSKSVLDGLKDVWKSFGNAVLSIITQLIAKLIIMKTLMLMADMLTGGAATAMKYAAKAVIPGLQTPEGSTRIVPGLPSMPQLIFAHGQERIGRGDSGSGMTLVVQGDYFESDEANAKIFERYHKYSRSIGA